jgi:uncharacterized protein DUF6220
MSSVARGVHLVAVWLFVACCIVQVFLAGLGVFDDPAQFEAHRNFGYTFGFLVLVILIAAILGRLGRWQVGLGALLIVLFALQSVFVAFRESAPTIAALHPVNGFFIIGIAILSGWTAWTARRAVSTA